MVPPILAQLFPHGDARSLRQLITDVTDDHFARTGVPPPRLLYPEDPPIYIDDLLAGCYGALGPATTSAQLPPGLDYVQRSCAADVLARVLEAKFRASEQPEDVLCWGWGRCRPLGALLCVANGDAGGAGAGGPWTGDAPGGLLRPAPGASAAFADALRAVECRASGGATAATDCLLSRPWGRLLERIGDSFWGWLTAHASLFVAMPGGTYLQITGPPVTRLASSLRATAACALAATAMAAGTRRRPRFNHGTPLTNDTSNRKRGRDVRRRAAAADRALAPACISAAASPRHAVIEDGGVSDEFPATQVVGTQPVVMTTGDLPAWSPQPVVPQAASRHDEVSTGRKRRRPNGWQRAAARRRACRAPVAGSVGDDTATTTPLDPRGHGDACHHAGDIPDDQWASPPSTQEQEVLPQEAPSPPQRCPRSMHRPPPPGSHPCSMLIDRSSLLYSATFGRAAGLPAKHPLRVLPLSHRGARRLLAIIFHPPPNVGTRSRAAGGRMVDSTPPPPPPPRHVPPPERPLLPLLQSLLTRARRCPYARLLARHCPLPTGWAAVPPVSCYDDPPGTCGAADTTAVQGSQTPPCGETKRRRDGGDGGWVPSLSPIAPCQQAVPPPTNQAPFPSVRPPLPRADGWGGAVESVPLARVTSFVWACLRAWLPPPLVGGTPRASRVLRKAVDRVVRAQRWEYVSVAQCLPGLSPRALFPWLPTGSARAKHLTALWVHWVLQHGVLPLMRSHFYITEAEGASRASLRYYRKPAWARGRARALRAILPALYVPLSRAQAAKEFDNPKRRLGVGTLRLLPKLGGMRPIVNLGCKHRVMVTPPGAALKRGGVPAHRNFESVNATLRPALAALTAARHRRPQTLGPSVFGRDDAHRRYAPYIRSLRLKVGLPAWRVPAGDRFSTWAPPLPGIHVVAADAARAFDGVDLIALLRVTDGLLPAASYATRRTSAVVPGPAGSAPRVRVSRLGEEQGPGPRTLVRGGDALARLPAAWRGGVVIDGGTTVAASGPALSSLIREHVSSSLVRFGRKRYHLQRVGIPQGSVLSALLCCHVYAAAEAKCLLPAVAAARGRETLGTTTPPATPPLSKAWVSPEVIPAAHVFCRVAPGILAAPFADPSPKASSLPPPPTAPPRHPPSALLLRLIDDFLFIATSRPPAAAFVRVLHAGMSTYGCRANPAKTVLNFDMCGDDGARLPRREVIGPRGTPCVPWCGLLVDCATLEIAADYRRYLGRPLATTMTVPLHAKPGAAFPSRLRSYLRPQISALLLDGGINSAAAVALNIYHACLMAAAKGLVYGAALPAGARPDARPRYFVRAVADAGRHLAACIKRRMRAAEHALRNRPRGDPASGYGPFPTEQGPDGTADAATGRPPRDRHRVRGPRALHARCPISAAQIRWLSLAAFEAMFRRRAAQHGRLLRLLRQQLEAPRWRRIAAELAPVTDPGKSAHLLVDLQL